MSREKDFKDSLNLKNYNKDEDYDGSEELQKIAQKAQIHPILPTKFNHIKRAELKKFERELLANSKDKNIKTEMVSPFPSAEVEEEFSKYANEAMNTRARLHWDGDQK